MKTPACVAGVFVLLASPVCDAAGPNAALLAEQEKRAEVLYDKAQRYAASADLGDALEKYELISRGMQRAIVPRSPVPGATSLANMQAAAVPLLLFQPQEGPRGGRSRSGERVVFHLVIVEHARRISTS